MRFIFPKLVGLIIIALAVYWLTRSVQDPRISAQLMIAATGSRVLFAGIILLAIEVLAEFVQPPRVARQTLSGWKAKLQTTYAGIVVIAIGAALQIVSVFAFKS